MKRVYGWAGGRAGGRAGVRYVITKFSQMDSLPNFLTHGAPLCARFARARSSANISFGSEYVQFELPLRIRINRIVPLKCKESKIKGLILVLVLYCFIPFRPYALPRDDAEVYNVSLVSYFSY